MIETGIVPTATPHTLTDVRATTGEYFSAGVEDLLINNSQVAYEGRNLERRAAGYSKPLEIQDELQALDLQERERSFAAGETTTRPDRREVLMLTPEDANRQYGNLGLKWSAPVPVREAELLAETKRRELAAGAVFRAARAPSFDAGGLGAGRAALSVAVDFLGSAIDPVNLAFALLPIVGPAQRALLAGRLGAVGGGAAAGAIEGVVGTALLEPVMAGNAWAEQRDYHWYDSAANIALGGVLGGGFGAIGGYLGRHTPPPDPSTGAGPRAGGPAYPPGPSAPLAPGGPPELNAHWRDWPAALERSGVPVPLDAREWTSLPAWDRQAPMVRSLEQISPETRRVAGEIATKQFLNGRPIDVEPVLGLDSNWRAPLADPLERLRLQVDQRRIGYSSGMPADLASAADSRRAISMSPSVALVEGSQTLPDQISTRAPPLGSRATRAMRPSSDSSEGRRISATASSNSRSDKAIGTSTRKVVQPTADGNVLRRLATEGVGQLKAALSDLAGKVPGVRVVGARAKGEANLVGKLKRKPQPLDTIPDWVGGRITVATPTAARRVLEELGASHRLLDIEDFLDMPKDGGYRAIHVQVELPNGLSAELQILPADIAAVFAEAHHIYDKWRSRDMSQATPEQFREAVNDKVRSTLLFEKAYQQWREAAAGQHRNLRPGELGVDARRFQFKAGGDEAGATDRLKGVTQWDQRLAGVTIVWEDEAGKLWIVDGHQRHALATRLAADGQDPLLHALVLRAANGETEGYARALAAFKNIAEGSGTAIDAAKILRETRKDPALARDLDTGRLPQLPPSSALVRDAGALAKLPDQAFDLVAAGKVEPAHAAHVTRILADPKQQTTAVGMLAKLQPDTSEQARLVVEQIRAAGFVEAETVDLFGRQDVAASLMLERAKVLEATARALRKDATVFRTLVERENVAAEAGNVLARDANVERLTDDKAALAVLEALANRAGTLSTALNEAARGLAEGRSLRSTTQDFLKAVRAEATALRPRMPQGTLGAFGDLERMKAAASAGDTIGDPAALERQRADVAETPHDLFGSPTKLAEAEAERLSAEGRQALEAHPELKAELEASERAAQEADLFGRAADALAACKSTGGQ